MAKLFQNLWYEPLIETQIQAPHMRQMIANSVVKVKPHDPQKDLITPLAADRPDKLYSYSLAQREDVFLDSDQMVYIYSESAIDQIQQIRNDSINLLAKKKKCQILDIPPIKHIADPLFYCKKNWCSVYCIDNERIFRKFKGLFVCVGDNQWQLRKGWTQEKLDTKVTCTKPSCNYDDLPVYENTRWYCDVNNNECSLFCDNQAIVSIKARCKLKTLTWMIEGGPVRCVHKGWCDERVLPEIERGSWTVSKGNKAANLVCQDHDNPYKAAAKCNKKTSQWEYVENLKCNQVCQTSDLAEIEDGWWEISNKKGVTADFHCREGAVKKAARCDGDTGKWIYKGAEKAAAVESSKKKKVSIINGVPSNLRCYKYCDQNDLVSQGVGQWILHQSAGKLSGKLYCDGEITKNAAVCDTNIGQWNYKPDLSCCSVTAQLAVKDGIWERYAYNRYRLFCNGVAQDLIYICEGGMWVAYPEINWGSIFSYCSTEAANARSSTYTELRSERELRQIDF